MNERPVSPPPAPPPPAMVNKPHRKCSRDGCQNFATQSKGGAIWAKLCGQHNAERKARQVRSRSQTKCPCGNAAPMDAKKCRRCSERDEVAQAQRSTLNKLSKCIARLRSISAEMGNPDYDLSVMLPAEELDAIADELEFVQAVI